MLRVQFRKGRDRRYRWFVINSDSKRLHYSSFPRSFETDQEAWEHAEWAMGASVNLVYENPSSGFTLNAPERTFDN